MKNLSLLIIVLFYFSSQSICQNIPKNWHLLDAKEDSFYGISLHKAYHFLESKKLKSKPIIVAVLDSGIDTLHEDLKDILWKNSKEISNNGIDDDGNGYVDDVYGWNFLGNANGKNLTRTTNEKTRIYYKYKNKFSSPEFDSSTLNKADLELYKTWKKTSNELKFTTESEVEILLIEMTVKALKNYDEIIKKEIGKVEYTALDLEKFEPKTKEGKQSKFNYLTSIRILEIDLEEKNTTLISQLEEYVNQKKFEIEVREHEPENQRSLIINDDYNNINDKFFGNSNVQAIDPKHGTHVSGLIAAERNNNKGVDGIADNAKIMALRVVPDGDEYDKDIALGIFYAVDNGAKIINMSFGKSYSPEKFWVDSAVKYAAAKDVLIIHAAGNDSKNIDSLDNFPCAQFLDKKDYAKNYITVGASTDPSFSTGSYIADFSNYGKNNVDVFAPGVKIYSTVPNINGYERLQGTSFSAPIVSGIAALLRSYFPTLTAIQTKQIIESTVSIPKYEKGTSIIIHNSSLPTQLKDACKTGGIVNAAKAVEYAFKIEQLINNKKKY